jgi:hypothetical protein
MHLREIIWQWVVPLLIYSGALLPLLACSFSPRINVARRKTNRRLLRIMLAVQMLSFVPLIISLLLRVPDAIHALTLPALVGVVLLIWGFVRCILDHVVSVSQTGEIANGRTSGRSQ